jgi:rhodanese-related sulfurtransferase
MSTTLQAPPDPVQARAYFAEKLAFTTGPMEVDVMRREGAPIIIVDVRAAEDYGKGHIPGAINLPRGTWASDTDLSEEITNIVYCYSQTCHLAARAAVELSTQGFPVMEMEGGFEAWEENDLEVER